MIVFIFCSLFEIVSLDAGGAQIVKVRLSMCCTARLSTSLVIVSEEKGYFLLPFRAESSPSSFLSLEEIQLGKTIGRGAYSSFSIPF